MTDNARGALDKYRRETSYSTIGYQSCGICEDSILEHSPIVLDSTMLPFGGPPALASPPD
jgi:hypothetical protein